MPSVPSRWHLVPSQNFLPDRYANASAVHGALERSTMPTIGPRLVVMVSVAVPVLGAFAGGVPTFTIFPPPPASSGVQVQATVPAGGALAAAARSAISRSSRARAAARCRSLIDDTVFPPAPVCLQSQDCALADGAAPAATSPTVNVLMVIGCFGLTLLPDPLSTVGILLIFATV